MGVKLASIDITLALIKPHVLKHPFAIQNIQEKITKNGLKILASKTVQFDANLAEQFYGEHKERFFFNRLVTYMTSGPCQAYVLSGPNAINKWRELMGPTKVYQAQFTHPDCIRSQYGLSDTRNATHGSDSPASVSKEIGILFPDIIVDDSR